MKKKWPALKSDADAERFVADADLRDHDFGEMVPMRFELAPKDERINMRLPGSLLAAVKAKARRRGLPYQRFIREVLEQAVRSGKSD